MSVLTPNSNPAGPVTTLLSAVTTTTSSSYLDVGIYTTLVIQVTGTWTGTVYPQGYLVSSTIVQPPIYDMGGNIILPKITANGVYRIPVTGLSKIRISSVPASGSVTVTGRLTRGTDLIRPQRYELLYSVTGLAISAGANVDAIAGTGGGMDVSSFLYLSAQVKADISGSVTVRYLPYPILSGGSNTETFRTVISTDQRGTSERIALRGQGASFNIVNGGAADIVVSVYLFGIREMAVRNPYATVDWAGVQVPGVSHAHGRAKADMLSWTGGGYQHLAISNYYASDPASSYPLTNLSGVTTGDIPAGVLGCPNAEHHSMSDCGGHFGAIGSTFASGSASPPTGYGGSWQSFVDSVVANLQYSDGGGVCINHPRLAYCGDIIAMAMLDYDDRVLGIEAFSGLGEWYYAGKGWADQSWHNILVTGRRCFGMAGLDHWQAYGAPGTPTTDFNGDAIVVPPARGFNRLLVPSGFNSLSESAREQACLHAYRDGRFYFSLEETSPILTAVTVTGSDITVQTAASCDITFISADEGDTAAQIGTPTTGTSATYTLTGNEVYVRAELKTSTYERSATQPIMFKAPEDLTPTGDEEELLLLVSASDFGCCGIGGW